MTLYEVLKARKTGLSPDLFTSLISKNHKPPKRKYVSVTGIPPLKLFSSAGANLVDWLIEGDTVQDGTPSPENPIEVKGVGDMTGNLFDVNSTIYYHNGVTVVANGGDITATKTTVGQWRYAAFYIGSSNNMKNKEYTISFSTIGNDDVIPFIRVVTFNKGGITGETEIVQRQSRIGEKVTLKFTVPNVDDKVICISFYPSIDTTGSLNSCTYTNIMLNEGSEPLSFEPFGYKIPFVSKSENEITIIGIQPTTNYAYFNRNVMPNVKVGDSVMVYINNNSYKLNVMQIDDNYIYIENKVV